ncbi:MAG: UDP-N-acetylmuramoyl-L-alanine--D-glutamate ligase [Acidimicrobiales bacterium]
MTHHLVLGLGITGRAVVRALVRHGEAVVAVDDRPSAAGRALARELGLDLVEAPDGPALRTLVSGATAVLPSPGVPDHHPVFALAAELEVPVLSEFDLAARWDSRPRVAVTGTDGKTTVTELVRSMFIASGRTAVAVGNTELPLVAAIDDPTVDVFVVEASSFRLLHSHRFAPDVGTWLNLAPDHLDPSGVGSHRSLTEYIAAKARIWKDQSPEQVAIGNADDDVVAAELRGAPGRQITFGLGPSADNRLDGDRLLLDTGDVLAEVDELHRSFPHDVANALAAAATAVHGGATVAGARGALLAFRGLPHRVALVGEAGGVGWYDDSKATAPHATRAAVRAFGSVVLIAGGRNKGLDLSELAADAERIRGVVAIGEAAHEVAAAFDGLRPVRTATSMDEAVDAAASLARAGDVVLLSPACASFDWYGSYAERGDDFARAVQEHLAGAR